MTDQDGYYYAKLGSTNLYGLEHPSFRITEELNKIPSFEFEIANCSENRTAIAAGITDVFRIYRRIGITDILMFTGIINGDAIEYLSLERIRITGYASFVDLNWRFHQHLNSEDAEAADSVLAPPPYVYYKLCTVIATVAGAQTNYQLDLLVGESSGAAGEDVDCENHCEDFPNDIRFTQEDGVTKHDYWIESVTGTAPNRLATVIIEVASIPASGSVDLYMHYGRTSDSGESRGSNTFELFDDFKEITEGETSSYLSIEGHVIDHTYLDEPEDVIVRGNYAYVVCRVYARLTIVDISNKTNPQVTGSVNTDAIASSHRVGLDFDENDENYIYVADMGKLVSVNVSNKANPTVSDELYLDTRIVKVHVQGNYAYVSSRGTANDMRYYIVDISDPTDMSLSGSIDLTSEYAGQGFSVWAIGNFLYCAPHGGNDFIVIDVSDKANPQEVAHISDVTKFGGQGDMFWDGNYMYVAAYNLDIITLVDISNPSSPFVYNSITDNTYLDGVNRLYISGNYLYAVNYLTNMVTVINISDPSNLIIEDSFSSSLMAKAYGVWADGTYSTDAFVYVVGRDADSLVIIDAHTPIYPEPWTVVNGGGGTLEIDRVVNDQVVFTNDIARGTDTWVYQVKECPSNSVKIRGKFNYISGDSVFGMFGWSDKINHIDLTTDGFFIFSDEGTNTSLFSYLSSASSNDVSITSKDTDYWFELIKDGTTSITLYIYTDAERTNLHDTLVVNSNIPNETNLDNFLLLTSYSTPSGSSTGYVDDLLVMKYASPEPTWGTWGSEQSVTGDYTTEANNDTINDVPITYSSVNDVLYVGQDEQFFGMQIKYSTKGVQAANTTVVWEYSEGNSVWSTLDILDETRQFTQDAGTYYITIPHKPSDWAKDTVNSVKKFWIRARLSAGSYTTSPALDRIKMTNVDVYRVYYFETAADTIMTDVLAGTGYSMDVTDACPSDTISIVAEYETTLRIVAGIANALTWDDSGDKKAYQWWIDTNKKVHFKQKRGATLGDITGELTILNNVEDYFNLSNRLHFFGNYDGLNQLRAVIENIDSQDTHEIRELAVPEERYNNYIPLKEAAQKAMTYTKAPLQKIAATVTTKYWLDNSFEVGDTVTLHATSWDVASQAFQIVRADIGARVTNLDMGISQEHLDALKAGLQRQLDISGIRMHGSTSLMQFGPETMNYQRVDTTTVYPSRLKIEIPSDVRYIHKVLLSWTIGPYRADVEPDTGLTSGHDHTGYTGSSSAHDHTGATGLDGGHTPTELGEAHTHAIDQHITMFTNSVNCYVITTSFTGYEAAHTHSIPATDEADGVTTVVDGVSLGNYCADACGAWLVDQVTYEDVSSTNHTHPNTAKNSGVGSSHQHSLPISEQTVYVTPISAELTIALSGSDAPAHVHTINPVPDHTNPITSQAGESLTVATEPGESVTVEYGIHEEAAGTTLELLVNSEVVASSYVGDQTDIRIDGYLSTGNNTVEIRPIVGENGKKGSCTVLAAGIFFIEAKKF